MSEYCRKCGNIKKGSAENSKKKIINLINTFNKNLVKSLKELKQTDISVDEFKNIDLKARDPYAELNKLVSILK